jgi:hypothetical protein
MALPVCRKVLLRGGKTNVRSLRGRLRAAAARFSFGLDAEIPYHDEACG